MTEIIHKVVPLVLEKTIYAKYKKYALSIKQVNEILQMEAETHIRNNPGLQFLKMGQSRQNEDKSITYVMMFAKRIVEPVPEPEKV